MCAFCLVSESSEIGVDVLMTALEEFDLGEPEATTGCMSQSSAAGFLAHPDK